MLGLSRACLIPLKLLMMAGISHSMTECQLSAIRQLESDLIDVLQHEIDEVLTTAWSVDIIGKQVRSLAAQSSLSCRVKAENFVAVIRDRLKTDPQTFDTFLKILKSTPSLKYLAEALDKKLCDQHRALTTDHLGGVPSMSSTPKSSTNSQRRYGTPAASNNSGSEYHTRTPPRGQKKRRHSSSDTNGTRHGQSSGHGQPKLETRDDTDEESGFQEELNVTHQEAANIEQLNESEKVDGDTYADSNRPDELSFKAPIEAQPDIKPFAKTTGVEPDVEAKSLPVEPDNDAAAVAGVVGQGLQHDATSQQQIVSGHGIQATAEGWAEKANFYVNQGAAKEAEMATEIEELKMQIASMKQQADANKEESQRMEQMEKHIHGQKAELDDCKEKLVEKEEELKKLDEQRKADIEAATEELKKECDSHEQKIARVEEEVRSLQNQLLEKNAEADNLRHNVDDLKKDYDELKKTTETQIQELNKQLMAKTKEATELKDQYQQLEESRKHEIEQIEQKYTREISELKELVESRKAEAHLKQENLEMKLEKEYQVKENQRLKEEHKLNIKIGELEMKLAKKEMQIIQMQKEEQTRLCEEATEKMEQQAKQHDEEKTKLKEEMERKFEEQRSIERTQSEKRFQDMVDNYEEKVRRMSSVSSTDSSEASLSMILRSNTGQSSNGGKKDDMDTITEEAARLRISKSDKDLKLDEDYL